MRKLLLLMIVVGLCGWSVSALRRNAQAGVRLGPVYEGFAQIRMTIQAGSRDLELVVIGERPTEAECQKPNGGVEMAMACPPGAQCAIKSYECTREIDPRYQRMLDMQPSTTHYVHFRVPEGDRTRRMVMVGWGMTEAESARMCERARALVPSTPLKDKLTASCI
ncbi:hypothetical protein [Tahibacter amnicola]|uniref:Uncharacterized protein n=1 Tax=Tahibacter amnicola TaxID=2976241 RepID=A0ABY6BKX0_9GAMM|nr:hypothetical protein [Tahibacter amnicola]UXI69236.1 hypothetical protein N4264_06195 [Tahibacter amnicola]